MHVSFNVFACSAIDFKCFLINSHINEPCRFNAGLPLSYESKCKQKHQRHTLKALNAERTAIVNEEVYYPSGCECRIFLKKKK